MSREPNIVRYVRAQLNEIATAPMMWGSKECIELSYLQLLETWLVAVRPDLDERNPRHTLEAYERFRIRHGFRSDRPLSELLSEHDLCTKLGEFQKAFELELRPQNPFEHHDLVLGLVLAGGVAQPSSSVLTSYVDELRRGLRGTLRAPEKRGGRPRKDIETLTEFGVPSVEIDAANGGPARVLFSLRQQLPPQTQLDQADERRVRDALGHLVVAAEWASSDDEGELSEQISDTAHRQRVAFEAMRLVPRGDVEEILLGGKIVARFEPVHVLKKARSRLADALAEGQTKDVFEMEGTVRAADLDRASIKLRSDEGTMVKCLVATEEMTAISRHGLDVRVRARGQRIHGISKAPLIILHEIELLDEEHDDDGDFDDVSC